MPKTLILYVFHSLSDYRTRPNIINFTNKHLFDLPDFKFVIICNSLDLDLSELNIPSYVKLIRRENKGFDFAGWSHGLLDDNLYEDFDYFLFINSSVAGPFIPPYYTEPWPTIFTKGINDYVKLYGSMINCDDQYGGNRHIKNSHVQSYVFSTDRIGLSILFISEILSITKLETDFMQLIINRELRMSREILNSGFNIGCLLKHYDGIDFHNPPDDFIPHGDQMFEQAYTRLGLHPYETVFIKTNRDINHRIYYRYT